MKNYTNSDYAANKKAEDIIYQFVDQAGAVTFEDYLRENPGKTEADFTEWKALSDSDYQKQDRDDYRQTYKNVPLFGLEETYLCSVPSPEDEIVEREEQAEKQRTQLEVAIMALRKLTDVQRRRYVMYHAHKMTEEQIALKEGASQQAISKSLISAERKIRKFFAKAKK